MQQMRGLSVNARRARHRARADADKYRNYKWVFGGLFNTMLRPNCDINFARDRTGRETY